MSDEVKEFMRDVVYAFADDEIEDGVEKDCPRCGKGLVTITVIGRRYWAEVEAEAPYMTTVHTADRCAGASAQDEGE